MDSVDYQKKRSAETLLMQNASAHTLKAGVGQTSSNNSIPQEKENVNKKISTNSENAKSDAWSKVDEIIESTIDDVLVQYGQGAWRRGYGSSQWQAGVLEDKRC